MASTPTTNQKTTNPRLLTRATASRCDNCPPDRVCAWGCVQGMNQADIVVGAWLEQSRSWAFQSETPAPDPALHAIMESFNS